MGLVDLKVTLGCHDFVCDARILSNRAIRSQFGYYDAVLLCTGLFLILSLAHNLAQDIPEVTIYPLAGYFGVVGSLDGILCA